MSSARTFETWMVAGAIVCGGMVGGADVGEARAQERLARSQMPLAPDFSAIDLRGRAWSLRALRGHPVILSLCATWCPPSREQLRELDALQRRYGKAGLVILAVSSEDQDTLTSYVLDNRLSVPMLTDPGDNVLRAFGSGSYPTTYFIGRDGRVLSGAVGVSSDYTQVLAQFALRELATPASPRPARASTRTGTRASARPSAAARRRARALMPAKRAAQIARARRKAKASDGVVLLSAEGARVLR